MTETLRRNSGLTASFQESLESPDQLVTCQQDFFFLKSKPGGRYWVGFVTSPSSQREAFRLRYEVFNLELEEGLESSHAAGLDRDDYDAQMTHLVLWDRKEERVVGTYRLQTVSQALEKRGLYSAREFDLTRLEPYFEALVECGRACIAREHRSFRAVFQLWSGIASFLNAFSHHLLFGCCSLTSQDPDDGWRAMQTIRRKDYLHPDTLVSTRRPYRCGDPDREAASDLGPALRLPRLFQAYMTLGARVISPPALERDFKTIDFLVLLDTHTVQMSALDLVR